MEEMNGKQKVFVKQVALQKAIKDLLPPTAAFSQVDGVIVIAVDSNKGKFNILTKMGPKPAKIVLGDAIKAIDEQFFATEEKLNGQPN